MKKLEYSRIILFLLFLGTCQFLIAQDTILVNNPIVVSYVDSSSFDLEYRDYYIASDDVYCKSRRVFFDSTYTNLVYSIEIRNDSAICEGYWLNGKLRTRDVLITKGDDLCPYYVTRREFYCENGNLVWKIDSADRDVFKYFTSYYCSGRLQRSCTLNALMGRVKGFDSSFYENGKLKSLERYDDHSNKCGFAYYWNDRGRLIKVKEFDCSNSALLKEYRIRLFNRRKWIKQFKGTY